VKLAYSGFDMSGRAVQGAIESAGSAEATEALRRQGVLVTSLRESASGGNAAEGVRRVLGRAGAGGGGGSLTELAAFSRQLSVLISAKTPLVQAIQAIERQTPPGAWQTTLTALRRRVEEGVSLSEAMEQFPRQFNAVCRALVQAGESGGSLDVMLRNLAELTRQQLHMRRSVVGALVYPVALISISSLVLVGLVLFVLPRFEELFKSLGAALPPSTQLLIDVSTFGRDWWWAVVPSVVGGVVGLVMFTRSDGGRGTVQRVLMATPRVGMIVRSLATARIARVLGALLEAKVGLLDALKLTRQATTLEAYAKVLEEAEERITRGENFSATLAGSPLIPPAIVEAVASGERSGQIGPVLTQVGKFMDEDNELIIKSLTTLLEPLILVILGVLIGAVAIAMFLPLFDLTAAGGGGPGPSAGGGGGVGGGQ
jgi:type IV pilus assembly protein PilC